jgi:hypothetical protein
MEESNPGKVRIQELAVASLEGLQINPNHLS